MGSNQVRNIKKIWPFLVPYNFFEIGLELGKGWHIMGMRDRRLGRGGGGRCYYFIVILDIYHFCYNISFSCFQLNIFFSLHFCHLYTQSFPFLKPLISLGHFYCFSISPSLFSSLSTISCSLKNSPTSFYLLPPAHLSHII